ncbi:hypothetical protein BDZ91DRAFT_795613 [Kalaharituber pfeilii]|nr:hypothetical protein BDZ91DRAFT_795613 [Kalaharituber pfeilii]
MSASKWTSFLVPQQAPTSGSDSESNRSSVKARRKSNKSRSKKEDYKDGYVDKYPQTSPSKANRTPYTKALLALTPGNHYSFEEVRWRDPAVLDVLKVRLVENAEIEEVVHPPLTQLDIAFPEVYSSLNEVSIDGNNKYAGGIIGEGPKIPLLWKQCLSELKHYIETDPLLVLAACSEEREPLIKPRDSYPRDKFSKRIKPHSTVPLTVQRPLKPTGTLAGANRPLVINFLRAICNEFKDCLAFEDLRYAWTINMYGHRKIRVGMNTDDKIKVNMREDICWRATKDPVQGLSPRDWTSKKRGLGPLFAVMTKDWGEFMDVKLSALADLKTLLTILQDRRRESAYTTSDDIFSRDSKYFSYIISVTSNNTPCVSVNTLSASGKYLAYMERGDYPPKGEELIYRKGRVLSLVENDGRIEFARIMMGLLNRVCTIKETRDPDPVPEEAEKDATAAVSRGGIITWSKVKKSTLSIFFFKSKRRMRLKDKERRMIKT